MRILIDLFTQVDEKTQYYRDNVVKHLGADKDVKLFGFQYKNGQKVNADIELNEVKNNFKWNKDLDEIYKIKPDGIIVFSKVSRQLLLKNPYYIYLEAIIGPEDVYKKSRRLKKVASGLNLYKGIIVRTDFLKLFLSNHYGIDKRKIIVSPLGFEARFLKENISTQLQTIRRVLSIYRVSKPYIFIYGNLDSNVYINKILEAFSLVHFKYPDTKLVIVSPEFKMGWDNKPQPLSKMAAEILSLCENYKISRKVIFTGIIEKKHFPIMVTNAVCCLYVSEGKLFSSSLVATLATGSAVIINDTPVLKEIVKGAGIVVSPKVTDSIVEAFHEILSDSSAPKKYGTKASFRAEYFDWSNITKRLVEKLEMDSARKTKDRLLLVTTKKSDEKRAESLSELFSSNYKLSFLARQTSKISSKNMIPLRRNFIRRAFQIVKSSRQNSIVYVLGPGDLIDAVIIFLSNLLSKHTKFITEFPQDYLDDKELSRLGRMLNRTRNLFIFIYLRLVFDGFVIDNMLLNPVLSRKFRIERSKIFFIPEVFEYEEDKKNTADLRETLKLKNYVCIFVRLDDSAKEIIEVGRIAEDLYKHTKDYKFLVADDVDVSKLDIEPKIKKKIVRIKKEQANAALSNSRIYFDFRHQIDQFDLFLAMRKRNLCIVRKTLAARFLIKEGINGYIYNSLETDKISKQIKILVDNRKHLDDVRRINHVRSSDFLKQNVKEKISHIIKKW